MNANDALYSPIVPDDKLRKLVKRLLDNPRDLKLLDEISDEIIELFIRHGINDEQEIVDAVHRTKQELELYFLVYSTPLKYPAVTSW